MATVSLEETSAVGAERKRSRRRKTSHLKQVPETRVQREHLRTRCAQVVAKLDKTHPLSKNEMERVSRKLLDDEGLSESLVGWMMVNISGEFWREQVAATPYDRRLLLLPHCLKHAEGCPADYDEFGLDCRQCGACSIADFRGRAEEMGYKVLVAEGSPIVLKIIVSGHVDAIVGVACLNVLEKAIDKILVAGIPCMAVPLLSSDCRNTSVDEEWVEQMITLTHEKPQIQTRSYIHLMRTASSMFEADQLDRLAPRLRGGPRLAEVNGQGAGGLDPIACTEAIAYDFLSKGGKHSRPFITLATYDALDGAKATLPDGAARCGELADAVLRAAISIETFHKASLVHDDIEDDDGYRYGHETLHRKYGTPTAINVGDYLIGLGYRLVSRETEALGHEAVADIVNTLADAHMRLSEGQGAELIWRDSRDKQLKPIDVLKIYALKTAPAFEAAVLTGIRLAGEMSEYTKPVGQFARQLGVAFQILNDLKDWNGDDDNKLGAGLDVLGGRPTVLLALALEGLDGDECAELLRLIDRECPTEGDIDRVRMLYASAGVFEKAHRLVDKYQDRAEEIADAIESEELRRLFYYLIDTVLDRVGTEQPDVGAAMVDIVMPGS
ncbi:MAG: polyprenyl synthetase family protein [Pirellulales bacterium]